VPFDAVAYSLAKKALLNALYHASRHSKVGADPVSLDATQVTSGRFPLSRLPDGPSGQAIVGQGVGVNPAWGFLPDTFARELALVGRVVDETAILPASVDYYHVKTGVVKPLAALPILTASESNSSTILTTTNQRTIWRGSLINMDRVVKVEVEVDRASGGAGDLDLYNVTDGVKIADLETPTGATTRGTRYYDVTSQMKAITADKVVALQIAGDGTNALTVYKAQLIVYMSLR
jgi:hypothetical protein